MDFDNGPQGNNVFNGFRQLIKKGKRVRCSRSGRYYYWNETVPDGKGGRIAKLYNFWVQDQSKTQSKYKQGPDWKMGARFRPTSMSDGTSDVTYILYDSLKNALADSTGEILTVTG